MKSGTNNYSGVWDGRKIPNFLGNSEHPLSVLRLSGVTRICDLVLTGEETQILNGSAQVRLAGEFNLSFKDNRFKRSMQNQFIFCCTHLRDFKFVKHF